MCNIFREKDDTLNLFPKYHVYCNNNKRYLLSAKKCDYNLTSKYIVMTEKHVTSNFIGKIKSDFMGLEFNAYNNGKHIKYVKNQKDNKEEDARKIYTTIKYVS